MEPQGISIINTLADIHDNSPSIGQEGNGVFRSILDEDISTASDVDLVANNPAFTVVTTDISLGRPINPVSNSEAIAAYKKQENQPVNPNEISDFQKYKDDQLLSNPGGDHYYLEQKRVIAHPKDQESFWGRLRKDFSDAFSNVKNFFQNLLFGAKIRYRDKNDQIQEVKKRGLVGSFVDFVKDVGSALSFGSWRPDGEKEPQGFVKRCGFFFSKMKEAIFGDLIQGVSGSIVHMGEDLVFAGWNLIETIPDATIGNFQEGKRLTTKIFDNGQVMMDYLTDIIPTGDAWHRVHSPNLKRVKPPVFYNIDMPEHHTGDVRWKYVRNTSFRKTIETIGSLLSDIMTLKILGRLNLFSQERHQRN